MYVHNLTSTAHSIIPALSLPKGLFKSLLLDHISLRLQVSPHFSSHTLMLPVELNDIIFMVRCLQSCHCCIDIHSLISFSSSDTRSASSHKMIHSISSTNHSCHFFFNRIPRLWNALLPIDRDLSINTIKKQLTKFVWFYFTNKFDPSNPCSFHFVCTCSKCSLSSLPSQFTKSL